MKSYINEMNNHLDYFKKKSTNYKEANEILKKELDEALVSI